jgi:hypothetical protein
MRDDVKPGPSAHPQSSFLSLVSGWVQQGVESFFATQRILVDLALRQNAAAVKVVRERLTDPDHSPVAILTELASEGTTNFIEAQKVLLKLAQEETNIIMNGVKDQVSGSSIAASMTDLWRRSVETFIEMQQNFLKIADKQTHEWLEDAKAGKGYDGARWLEFAREGMENFVRTQQKFLDVIAEETAKITSGKEDRTAKKMKKSELAEIAREATDSFIEAQRKLLYVAGRQMNVHMKAASKTVALMSPFGLMPIAELTGQGVKSFVEAEKAVLGSMIKPHNGAKGAAKPKPHPKARVHPRKPEGAQVAQAGA